MATISYNIPKFFKPIVDEIDEWPAKHSSNLLPPKLFPEDNAKRLGF